MIETKFDSKIAEMDEQAARDFERAIQEQKRNVYKVTFRGKADSKDMLEIFTVASGVDMAIKKVLGELYSNKEKYRYVFHCYAVYPTATTRRKNTNRQTTLASSSTRKNTPPPNW